MAAAGAGRGVLADRVEGDLRQGAFHAETVARLQAVLEDAPLEELAAATEPLLTLLSPARINVVEEWGADTTLVVNGDPVVLAAVASLRSRVLPMFSRRNADAGTCVAGEGECGVYAGREATHALPLTPRPALQPRSPRESCFWWSTWAAAAA
jgi:hypothetical protein